MTRVSNIGSYVGVPLQFSDGRLFGTVCCMSHSSHPELRERDAGFMGVIARLIASISSAKSWRRGTANSR